MTETLAGSTLWPIDNDGEVCVAWGSVCAGNAHANADEELEICQLDTVLFKVRVRGKYEVIAEEAALRRPTRQVRWRVPKSGVLGDKQYNKDY